MFTHIKILFYYMVYRMGKSDDYTMYLAGQDKGMLCTGIQNGIVEFDPNYPPQEKPSKTLPYKEFYNRFCIKTDMEFIQVDDATYHKVFNNYSIFVEKSIIKTKDFDSIIKSIKGTTVLVGVNRNEVVKCRIQYIFKMHSDNEDMLFYNFQLQKIDNA